MIALLTILTVCLIASILMALFPSLLKVAFVTMSMLIFGNRAKQIQLLLQLTVRRTFPGGGAKDTVALHAL
jgi:hypothetical protein